MMSRLMEQIGIGLEDMPHCRRGCELLGAAVPLISWVDDLALPLATEEPTQMIPLIKDVVCLLHATFQAHGMSMNVEKGKSKAVIMYRGNGANGF